MIQIQNQRAEPAVCILMPCVENHIVALSFPEETKEQKKKAHLYFFSFRPEIHPYVFTKGVQRVYTPPPRPKIEYNLIFIT